MTAKIWVGIIILIMTVLLFMKECRADDCPCPCPPPQTQYDEELVKRAIEEGEEARIRYENYVRQVPELWRKHLNSIKEERKER